MLLCTFENKDVHAIDYASGDIMHQFIFKDDMIKEDDYETKKPIKLAAAVKTVMKIPMVQKKKTIIKSERISPREIHKQEIVNNFKSTFFKNSGNDDLLSNGIKTPVDNKTPLTMQRRLTRLPSPSQKQKKTPRIVFSQSQKRTKPYGILGIDTL